MSKFWILLQHETIEMVAATSISPRCAKLQ